MLRYSVACLIPVARTSAPTSLLHAIDMAFCFPRFQPHTHVQDMNVPEIRDALALLQTRPPCSEECVRKQSSLHLGRWSTNAPSGVAYETESQRRDRLQQRDKGVALLERALEIFESLGGAASPNPTVADITRSLYATWFELLNGVEHLPRPAAARKVHVPRTVLKHTARLLFYNDHWDRGSVLQIDTACVILAHFVQAFCALHTRPFHSSPTGSGPPPAAGKGGATYKSGSSSTSSTPSSDTARQRSVGHAWSLPVGGSKCPSHILTLPLVMERVDELLRLSEKAHETHGKAHPELRWHVPKLLLLKALLTIPLSGNLQHAKQHVDKAANLVHRMKQPGHPIMSGLKHQEQEPELGLFLLAQADMTARMFDWTIPPGEVDEAVLLGYETAAKFYADPFDSATVSDGIMQKEKLPEREFEALAYACCLRSYADVLHNAPRPAATSLRDSPVFLPKQIFTRNALMTVDCASNMIFADIQHRVPLPIEVCRKHAGVALERALQINRTLYPDHHDHPTAAWTLLSMACMYADTRDYLYATGLFETARKAFSATYGEQSLEHLLLLKLRYEFLAGVGSEDEAKTASREVVHLLKRLDDLPK